jgi:membrane protein implicated in regulation of membrane protease activity
MHSEAFRRVTRTLMQILPLGWEEDPHEIEAIVFDLIPPHCTGYIKFQGSWWRARCLQQISLEPGTVVRVVDRESLTLIVEPLYHYESSFNLTVPSNPYAAG